MCISGLNLLDILNTLVDSGHAEVAAQSTKLLELIEEMQEEGDLSTHSQVFDDLVKQVSSDHSRWTSW